jgi:hypothetical protein
MSLICREVDEYPLGPDQLHEPPDVGCGPRSTSVLVELTVALFSSAHDEPLFTEMYGVIVVGVQEPPLLKVRL